MAKKRARDDRGHFIKDDPTTEKNEAWVEEETIDPTRKAKQAKAPKNDNKSEFCFFVSSNQEAGVWDFIIGEDRFSGYWDADRAHVHWKIPRLVRELAMKHHHVWSGRIMPADDE